MVKFEHNTFVEWSVTSGGYCSLVKKYDWIHTLTVMKIREGYEWSHLVPGKRRGYKVVNTGVSKNVLDAKNLAKKSFDNCQPECCSHIVL